MAPIASCRSMKPVMSRKGRMRVVEIAIGIGRLSPILHQLEIFRGHAFGEHFQALIGLALAGRAATVEDGHAHQLAHGRMPTILASPDWPLEKNT
jgi:hypothetical protein